MNRHYNRTGLDDLIVILLLIEIMAVVHLINEARSLPVSVAPMAQPRPTATNILPESPLPTPALGERSGDYQQYLPVVIRQEG